MTEKELRRLSRIELMEVLIELEKQNRQLAAELEAAQAELKDRSIKTEEIGTMAQAAMVLNGVYEAADAAAAQYIESVKQMCEQAEEKCRHMLATTGAQCRSKIEETNRYVRNVNKKVNEFYDTHPGVREFVTGVAESEEETES